MTKAQLLEMLKDIKDEEELKFITRKYDWNDSIGYETEVYIHKIVSKNTPLNNDWT